MKSMKLRLVGTAITACLMGIVATSPAVAGPGKVFVGTNHTNMSVIDPNDPEPSNEIAMFDRAENGELELMGYFNTGGQGSGPAVRFAGDGLGSGHSVWLSQNRRFLFATNAGSDTLSVFRIRRDGLTLVEVEPTGDGSVNQRFPNSVTQHGRLVYVLNSAGNGSITGFWMSSRGTLRPIPGSTRTLQANQLRFPPDPLLNPAQVQFTPDGRHLVVTLKDGPAEGAIPGVSPSGPGRILVFSMDRTGRPSETFTQTNTDNAGPFGFNFDSNGNLLTALFIGGPNLTSSAGSFSFNSDGTLNPITANVPAPTEIDLCWLENNGRFAYGSNYTTGTITSYSIGADGALTLLDPVAGTTEPTNVSQGTTPLDLAITDDGRYLYNVLPGSGRVAAWAINNSDGSLTSIGEFEGLGQTVDGDNAPGDFLTGESPAGIAAF